MGWEKLKIKNKQKEMNLTGFKIINIATLKEVQN